nr:outer membrane beta-barrel protein [Rubritepida sp.]
MRGIIPGLAALALLGGAAQAQPISGLYVGAGLGANWNEKEGGQLGGISARVQTRWGLLASGSVGWGFGNGVRAELEVSYRDNAAENITLANNIRGQTVGGAFRQVGVMGNAFYDFHPGLNLGGMPIVPYLGAGIGYAWLDYDNVTARLSPTTRAVVNGSDGAFAYQAMAGVAFGLDAALPGLAFTVEYRYFGTLEPSVPSRIVNNAGLTIPGATSGFAAANNNHAILVGLRYAVNAPRPVPPPAPAAAPAPARTFLVFFDWDRADLT